MLKEYTKQRGMVVSKVTEYVHDVKLNNSAVKQEKKSTLVITVNDIGIDANSDAINSMSAVVALANFKFNALLADGKAADEAYKTIYNSTVDWKGADNNIYTLKITDICTALETAMGAVANILGV